MHDENRRDPLADSFVSTMCDSGMLERPEEKFHEDPSPALTWDSQWGSEMMETTTSRNGFGGDAQYDRAFGEHLDLFNAQQNDVRKRLCVSSGCERNYIQPGASHSTVLMLLLSRAGSGAVSAADFLHTPQPSTDHRILRFGRHL